MPESLIALGLSTDHLVSVAQGVEGAEGAEGVQVEPNTAAAFQVLAERAAAEGYDLRIASAFRDYDRQVRIVNDKWRGLRSVTDADGRILERTSQTDIAWLSAILRFSALPGTSRHHWGTDLDIWDAAAVSEDYKLSLSPAEYEVGGVFSDMTRWLDERMHADDAEGFFKPYALDRGGVAPEAWHISYRPVARQYQNAESLETLMSLWRGEPDGLGITHEPLAMLGVIEPQAASLLARFVDGI